MAFTKKTWVNVPDPSNLPDVPEGQGALARFDAENMNRIEEGIEEALGLTPEDIGAVALYDDIVVGTKQNHSSDGGIRFGIRYTEEGIPIVGMGTQRGSNSLILTSGCDYTNFKKETELGQRGYYFPVQVDEGNTSYPVAIKVSNQDGKAYVVRSSNGRKYYDKNEIIPMSEHEILHTGNASTLVKNAIEEIPPNTGFTVANSLGVKSIANGIAIKENDDLNTYIKIGNYVCTLTSTAQTLSNCPINSAFVMTVGYASGTSSYLYQEVTHFSTGVKHYRTYTASNKEWSEWRSTYSTSNRPTPEDIGASRIAYGTYVGTGVDGGCTLTADFDIKFVVVQASDYSSIPVVAPKGVGTVNVSRSRDVAVGVSLTWSGNTVCVVSPSSAGFIFNKAGRTYYYVLIG